MDPACQVGKVLGHGGSIMVWGLFSGHCLGFWCVYPPPLMEFGTQSCWVIASIRLCCSLIRMEMEFSNKSSRLTTGWLDEHLCDLSVINWAPRSTDFNPIEHI
ncbi:transposable element Tcb2 transposase [Trichonephila clavipes]|nr:transposable element Tcb2 transposase [Trichonephila clavipes]